MTKKITKQELAELLKIEIENKVDGATLSNELATINTTITNVDNAVTSNTQAINAVSQDVEANAQAINTLNSNVTNLNNELAKKVEAEAGKGLSANDFTDAEKEALDVLQNEVVAARDSFINLSARLAAITSSVDNIDLSSAVTDAVTQAQSLVNVVDNKLTTHINDYNVATTLINSRIDDVENGLTIVHIDGGSF